MSGLRERIVHAIAEHWPGDNVDCEECADSDVSPISHLADAVIRELRLWEKFRKTEKPWSREIINDWEAAE